MQPGDEIEVIRFKKYHEKFSMAKPCLWCMTAIKQAGIKKIKYTNWNGDWESVDMRTLT